MTFFFKKRTELHIRLTAVFHFRNGKNLYEVILTDISVMFTLTDVASIGLNSVMSINGDPEESGSVDGQGWF